MSGKAFIDTNVLVYAFDRSDPKRQRPAADLLRELVESDRAVVSVQVLKELFRVISSRLRQTDRRVGALFAWGLKVHGIDKHLGG